ncbi:MBL fold metallo-hydrolase [Paenibacillus selenitireducens]|uniref:MBL fold metallo-hydrolase n=1 Tax=Paenibacillus selenitireducens TaxID=1324314 RepID=A0A1T2X3Z8_9BACL|nr:MBL fold metallo-hydrolase [Paenibacillus selenitireducens]OPA74572.1 MBL fold metallo-hydrolase [Paenibacillus selenitireducens]
MNIVKGVEALEITANLLGELRIIYPTLLWDQDEVILVDAGYPGQLDLFHQAFAQAGVSFDQLTKIMITHQDIDHIGGLPGMIQGSQSHVEIISHPLEQPYIQGERRILKFSDEVIAQMDSWPEEHAAPLKRLIANPPKATVDTLVTDGQVLPYCGGITVIDTPGHTPGHISLYHISSKTLIAGDALVIKDGELYGSDPSYTLDLPTAQASIKNLTRYDIEHVICYHGGIYQGQANQRIAQLASEA